MKKGIAFILSAALLTALLSGCGTKEPAPSQSPTPPAQSEPATQTPATQTPATQTPATQTPAAPPEPEKGLTEFESDFGYTISYQEDRFDYRRTEGYDEYVLKSDALDKPFVFICVAHVGAEFVEAMKAASLGESPEDCTIGKEQMQALCSETREAWDGGDIIRKTYVCPLDNGDALLIETQWYTEQTNDAYGAQLWEMVNSIAT